MRTAKPLAGSTSPHLESVLKCGFRTVTRDRVRREVTIGMEWQSARLNLVGCQLEALCDCLSDRFRSACDTRDPVADDDGALHQFRVVDEQVDYRLPGSVVGSAESEFIKSTVFPDQVGNRALKLIDQGTKRFLVEGMIHVPDDFALHTAPVNLSLRDSALCAMWIEVDDYGAHQSSRGLASAQYRVRALD